MNTPKLTRGTTIRAGKNTLRGALCVLAAIALARCTAEPAEQPPSDKVILFYMGGDNNLSGEVDQKIDALCRGWQPAKNDKLLIYSDQADANPLFIEATGKGGYNVIRDYPAENSADWRVFASVIDEARRLYPARSYGLVVFSHASGWLPSGALENPLNFEINVEDWNERAIEVILTLGDTKSIITDGRSEMEIPHFARAIPDRAFDFIVFEACFMAGVEVAYQLKDKADYIMASSAEILSPGFTHIYSQGIGKLFSGDVTGFGRDVFASYDSASGYQRSATFSVIKTSELENLVRWVGDHCLPDRISGTVELQHYDRNDHHLFFDFADYCMAANQNGDVAELARLLDRCVVWKGATPQFLKEYGGFDIESFSGLTTYVPRQEFERLNTVYSLLDWSRRVGFDPAY